MLKERCAVLVHDAHVSIRPIVLIVLYIHSNFHSNSSVNNVYPLQKHDHNYHSHTKCLRILGKVDPFLMLKHNIHCRIRRILLVGHRFSYFFRIIFNQDLILKKIK